MYCKYIKGYVYKNPEIIFDRFERFFLSRSLYFAHQIILRVTCFDLSSLSNTDLKNRTYETISERSYCLLSPDIQNNIFSFPFLSYSEQLGGRLDFKTKKLFVVD